MTQAARNAGGKQSRGIARAPPQAFFAVSAIFHYLGPSLAVLLFAHLAPLGVAWLRIASAGAVFAVWRRPWRVFAALSARERGVVVALGLVLAAMNTVFYEAIARLPLGTVGAIEFLGPIALAAFGLRTRRNLAALGLAAAGVWALAQARIAGDALGFALAFANCALFALYIVLGHRIASMGGALSPVDRLAAAMAVATLAILPVGVAEAAPAFLDPALLGAGIGVGLCSSVIPYVCDQIAMSRLPRASFALMLSLLPAIATIMGVVVLRQIPSATEVLGVALVAGGVALHRGERPG